MNKYSKIVALFTILLGITFNQCFPSKSLRVYLENETNQLIDCCKKLDELDNQTVNKHILQQMYQQMSKVQNIALSSKKTDIKSISLYMLNCFRNLLKTHINDKNRNQKLFTPLEKKIICWLDILRNTIKINNISTYYLEFRQVVNKLNKSNNTSLLIDSLIIIGDSILQCAKQQFTI
ncbi:MAG: hypothetical protein V1855_01800 [bacterium]